MAEAATMAGRVPPGTDPELAVFFTLARVALGGVHDAALAVGETVVIIGLGTVGLLAAQQAQLAGARVIGVDRYPLRLGRSRVPGHHHHRLRARRRHRTQHPVATYILAMLDLYGFSNPRQREHLANMAREGQRKDWWNEHADLLPEDADRYLSLEAAASYVPGCPATKAGIATCGYSAPAHPACPGPDHRA